MLLSTSKRTLLFSVIFCLIAQTFVARAQTPTPPTNQSDDVVRVNSELVQTDVTVFDKQGRFVDNLAREQFELKVDGKPVAVSFFERVVAGSNREEALMSAARGGPTPTKETTNATASERGRTIIFFLDDLHLSAESVERTRKTILDFIEREMSPADQVLVASSSGQIGFLSQFTDNRAVLRAALARITYRPTVVRDAENISMTEYTALRIDQNDRDAIDYYVTELLKATTFQVKGGMGAPKSPFGGNTTNGQTSGMTREMAERNVRERAANVLKQTAQITTGTLYALESLMRSSQDLPGRKLVFFVSDGFYLNDRNTAFSDKLKQITDAATRAGVVIYTMDARGLVSMTDAGSNRADPMGRLGRSNVGELAASQDPLATLADDTGGRALLNSAALTPAVKDALRETANYYRLAWRPETGVPKGGKFKRIEISVAGRPELNVRAARGYLDTASNADATVAKPSLKTAATNQASAPIKPAEAELRAALLASTPKRALPIFVSATFLDTPTNGPVLTASTQVSTDALDYGAGGKQPAAVDVAGFVLNAEGKQVSGFKQRLNVNPLPANAGATTTDESGVIYNYRAPLAPGLYQLRVAARDEKSGRTGSAMQWIEIPDLKLQKLSLSSLLVGVQLMNSATQQKASTGGAVVADQPQAQFSVDHRFPRAARLGFWVFVYNASKGANAKPDLAAQVQVFRNGQSIVNTPFRPLLLEPAGDAARVPYIGSFPLQSLAPGRYLLQVSINDRLAKMTATERAYFVVE